jgi:hypothetical protein
LVYALPGLVGHLGDRTAGILTKLDDVITVCGLHFA